ncbi:hypothetical protein U7230_10875 [Carboxydochorda subterranea]|uniref:Uncharacterized protein n=1 Tax=Carboxydichorda subterranea TaxID=3109565 RepID=A0ABZ1BVM8_9FIRM|nr:hypothetical protein [Limnochorda sp. L945t]WRP16591.1 hypothetical protein U7230_10875 [Limnochorda sp. L945t]
MRAQQARVERLEAEVHAIAMESGYAPVFQALQTLKGIREVRAVTLWPRSRGSPGFEARTS